MNDTFNRQSADLVCVEADVKRIVSLGLSERLNLFFCFSSEFFLVCYV